MRLSDKLVGRILMMLACSSAAILLLITVFIFREGGPLLLHVGLGNFFSQEWHPTQGQYGIALMVVGSFVVTFGALVIGVPIGIACAIVLTEMTPPKLRQILKPAIEIQAGIPPVV